MDEATPNISDFRRGFLGYHAHQSLWTGRTNRRALSYPLRLGTAVSRATTNKFDRGQCFVTLQSNIYYE